MPVTTPRFRVADESSPDFPRQTCFTVEEFRDGAWTYYLFDHLPVSRPTLAEAEELADRLEHGQDISEDQKRAPVRWYAREDWDPTRPVLRRSYGTASR
jgi:hypothetical protein